MIELTLRDENIPEAKRVTANAEMLPGAITFARSAQ